MKIPSRWKEYVKGCADGAAPSLQRKAINLLAEDRESRQRARARASPRLQRKAEDAAAKDAETDALRAAAMDRADGLGELCGEPLGVFDRAPNLCHLDGGSGKRQEEQWIGNVLIEHVRCHTGPGGLDVTPLEWLPRIRTWCVRYGYPLPERFRKLEALHGRAA